MNNIDKTLLETAEKVKKAFGLEGAVKEFCRYGDGHINLTWLMILEEPSCAEKKYIVQKINNSVFKDVGALMANISSVVDHLSGIPGRHLQYVKTVGGGSFCEFDDGFYRVYDFLENTMTVQIVEDAWLYQRAGKAFAGFLNSLADFDASKLAEVIPAFHDTRKRFADFKKALAENKSGRADNARAEIEFVLAHEKYAGTFTDMLKEGSLPLRVTHNDTKINNVLFDLSGTDDVVIDLDTVMPGAAGYDFGDAIRSGCNSAAEDEPDILKVFFKKDLFKAFAEGYISEATSLTKKEKETLAFSAVLMTYECGMRFLADYIEGDVYFRTSRECHNLDRARTQFKLVADMEDCLDEMNAIIVKI